MLKSCQTVQVMIYTNPPPLVYELAHSTSHTVYTILMVIFAFLIIASVIQEQQKPKQPWYNTPPSDEYNFMAEEESAESRLNLAEAYIDIGHIQDAQSILSELLNVKNPVIKEQAKQLLKKI